MKLSQPFTAGFATLHYPARCGAADGRVDRIESGKAVQLEHALSVGNQPERRTSRLGTVADAGRCASVGGAERRLTSTAPER